MVTIKGMTPLIMHRFSEKAQKQIADKQAKKAVKNKPKRDPKAEFEAAYYRDADGDAAMPAINFKAAMLRVYKLSGFGNKNEIRFGVYLPSEFVKIEGRSRMRTDTVRLGGMSNPADLRYRPEFKTWSAELRIDLNTDVISIEQFLSVFTNAGRMAGIGEWRPEKTSGNFGTWQITGAVVLEESIAA